MLDGPTRYVSALVVLVSLTLMVSAPSVFAQDITLNVALEAGRMSNAAKSVVSEFEERNPNIDVKIVPQPYTTFQTKMTNVLATRAGTFDVFEAGIFQVGNYVKNDWVLPLDKYIEKYNVDADDFLSAYWAVGTLSGRAEQVNPKGSVYGIPYNGDAMLTVYRKDLYREHGLSVPEDWDQFLHNVETLDREEDLAGVALSGARAQNSHIWADLYNIAFNIGEAKLPVKRVGDQRFKVQVNNPAMVKALRYYTNLVEEDLGPSGMPEYRYSEKNTAIAQAIAAHTFQWMLAGYGTFENPEKSKVAGNVGYAPLPGKGISVTGGWILQIAATTDHPEASFKFIKFLTNTRNNRDLAIEYGNGPVRKSSIRDPKFQKEFGELANAFLEGSREGTSVIAGAPTLSMWLNIISKINFRAYDAIFKGEDPRDMLERAEQEIAQILEDQGYTAVTD